MRISDWSSDVCSSDLAFGNRFERGIAEAGRGQGDAEGHAVGTKTGRHRNSRKPEQIEEVGVGAEPAVRADRIREHVGHPVGGRRRRQQQYVGPRPFGLGAAAQRLQRSEEHTSELQSLMRISYAVFCLKKKKKES